MSFVGGAKSALDRDRPGNDPNQMNVAIPSTAVGNPNLRPKDDAVVG